MEKVPPGTDPDTQAFKKMMQSIEEGVAVPLAPEKDDAVNIDAVTQFIDELKTDADKKDTFERFKKINQKIKEVEALQKIVDSETIRNAKITLIALRDRTETETA